MKIRPDIRHTAFGLAGYLANQYPVHPYIGFNYYLQ
jgi:hypothetical protein